METKKKSMAESIQLTAIGYKVLMTEAPWLFLLSVIQGIVGGSKPLVAIYFMARILDEMTGFMRLTVLRDLILLSLLAALFLGILDALLKRVKNVQVDLFRYRIEKLYINKWLQMDFPSVDDPKIKDKIAQIRQNNMYNGLGIRKLYHIFESVVGAMTTLIGAIYLSASFFTARIPAHIDHLIFLNHWLVTVGLILILLVGILIPPLLSAKSFARYYQIQADNMLVNRVYMYIANALTSFDRQMDMRMNEQTKYIDDLKMKVGDNFFTTRLGKEMTKGLSALYNVLSDGAAQIFIGVIYLLVGIYAWAGAFSVGAASQYIGAMMTLSGSIGGLFFAIGELFNNVQFLETTFEYLNEPNHMYQGSLSVEKRHDHKYEIEFCDVSFQYPGTDHYALKNVSFKIETGKRLAIVGENGSGKTTFIKLLSRMYDPTEGVIKLNGIDIKKYDYHEYLNIFSVVFQDFKLLAFELGQNVAAGMAYDEKLVLESLDDAGFKQRLTELPDGLATFVNQEYNEDGILISGGEGQKIALARALYKNASFIILDEPTASLDPLAEFDVYARMDEMTKDKTAIFISHRLSSCRFCQNIVVFDQGHIIQSGSHDQLLAENEGKYAELWNAQAQYYV